MLTINVYILEMSIDSFQIYCYYNGYVAVFYKDVQTQHAVTEANIFAMVYATVFSEDI